MPDRYISVTHAAAALGIDPSRLRKLCRQGRVAGARRIGRDSIVSVGRPGRPRISERRGHQGGGPRATWARRRKTYIPL